MVYNKLTIVTEVAMKKTSDAQLQAIKRYQQKLDDIRIRAPKGIKEKVQEKATSNGESVNAYILRLILQDLGL